ncbi:chromosome partitioning protein ParB [bacterium]|nr:chromosome partitioning protein ParB [bacterium]|tara:strand:+ start:6036 stop:7127 length:1092 start_codon:yes stop_codon:yes gene_type:complete
MASDFYNNSVFWIEVHRIQPNPYQPRKEFDEEALKSLSESIRQYGILQPLVVTRREIERGDGGISVEYELVAGERRLRASKMAGVSQVPVLIRSTEDSDKAKLELAIIENLQREDLNPIDRALAFQQLAEKFSLKHVEIAKKVGRSREYVSNSLRLLALSDEIRQAVVNKQITEGHTRPLLMLCERPEQQMELFREIQEKKLTVREAERIARSIATDKARKQDLPPELAELERELTERLGTRVQIETRDNGGKMHIDFFTPTDVQQFLALISVTAPQEVVTETGIEKNSITATEISQETGVLSPLSEFVSYALDDGICDPHIHEQEEKSEILTNEEVVQNTNQEQEKKEDEEEDIYSISNFSV